MLTNTERKAVVSLIHRIILSPTTQKIQKPLQECLISRSCQSRMMLSQQRPRVGMFLLLPTEVEGSEASLWPLVL